VLARFVKPGGLLVFRANHVGGGWPDPGDQLIALGLRPDGIIERTHPGLGLRRTAYIRAPIP
jgi:hypothetical protein